MGGDLALLQLWQIGTKTCRLTSATQPAPYWVVLHDGDNRVSQRTFDNHDDATAYAVEELSRATGTIGPR